MLLETLFPCSTLLKGVQYSSILELLFKEYVNQLILCCWEQNNITIFFKVNGVSDISNKNII